MHFNIAVVFTRFLFTKLNFFQRDENNISKRDIYSFLSESYCYNHSQTAKFITENWWYLGSILKNSK